MQQQLEVRELVRGVSIMFWTLLNYRLYVKSTLLVRASETRTFTATMRPSSRRHVMADTEMQRALLS